MSNTTTQAKIEQRLIDISQRSREVLSFASDSQFNADGSFIKDPKVRAGAIVAAMRNVPMFLESTGTTEGELGIIGSAWGAALAEYANKNNSYPRADILASAHKALENVYGQGNNAKADGSQPMMLEAVNAINANLDTSEGIQKRALFAAMILPVMLSSATSDACTFVPCNRDITEVFKMTRIAGSTSGDYKAGDALDVHGMGQYSQMRQWRTFAAVQQPDGTKKAFTFDTKTDCPAGISMPLRRGRTVLYVNRKPVATDKNGDLMGKYVVREGGKDVQYVLTGSVDMTKGVITVSTETALPDGLELATRFECDIEKAPELIPTITHEMESFNLSPSEYVLAAEHTIQALVGMQREFGIDMAAMAVNDVRAVMSDEIDKNRLKCMLQGTTRVTTFDVTVPSAQKFSEFMENLRIKLNSMSQQMSNRTKTVGITGMFAGGDAANLIKSLPTTMFTPAANYRQQPRIHFVGTLFGQYKVYEVPTETCNSLPTEYQFGSMDMLCYGRGDSIGAAGFIAGDAVPPIPFDHPTNSALRKRHTLWGMGLNEMSPNNGEDYFVRLRLTQTKGGDSIDVVTGLMSESL